MTEPLSQILTAALCGVVVLLVLCALYAERGRW